MFQLLRNGALDWRYNSVVELLHSTCEILRFGLQLPHLQKQTSNHENCLAPFQRNSCHHCLLNAQSDEAFGVQIPHSPVMISNFTNCVDMWLHTLDPSTQQIEVKKFASWKVLDCTMNPVLFWDIQFGPVSKTTTTKTTQKIKNNKFEI